MSGQKSPLEGKLRAPLIACKLEFFVKFFPLNPFLPGQDSLAQADFFVNKGQVPYNKYEINDKKG
jgi:hypothetical protein